MSDVIQDALDFTFGEYVELSTDVPAEEEAAINPGTITAILDAIRQIAALFCPGVSSLKTAGMLKNPPAWLKKRHERTAKLETRDKFWEASEGPFPEVDDYDSKRQFKIERRDYVRRRKHYGRVNRESIESTASRIVAAERKSLAVKSDDEVAALIDAYRAREEAGT